MTYYKIWFKLNTLEEDEELIEDSVKAQEFYDNLENNEARSGNIVIEKQLQLITVVEESHNEIV